MLKHLSENLNLLMAKNRLNSNELARQIGIPATTIKRIRNNEQANPTITTLLPIAQYFSISVNQLIGNDPSSLVPKAGKIIGSNKIPLLTWHECIHFASFDYEKMHKQIFTERYISAKAFGIIVEDDDIDVFPKGGILIVEPEKIPTSGDYVIVGSVEQNVATIRKFIIEIDKTYLKPLIFGVDFLILTPAYKIIGVIIQYKIDLKL